MKYGRWYSSERKEKIGIIVRGMEINKLRNSRYSPDIHYSKYITLEKELFRTSNYITLLRPVCWDRALQRTEQRLPMWFPTARLVLAEQLPRDWDGTTTIEHTDVEHREAVREVATIQGQGQPPLSFWPPAQEPAQQRDKAGAHLQLLPLLAFLACVLQACPIRRRFLCILFRIR